MNKKKFLKVNSFLVSVVFLGIMILGIGLVLYGMFSFWGRTDLPIISDIVVVLNESVESIVEKSVVEELVTQQSNYDIDIVADEPLYPVVYPVYPVEGDNIGDLIIPVLNLELPIFQGTSNKELKKGVGHFIQSVLPGEQDNSVLSGHRETVFREIGELVIGDLLIVETSAGIFTYEVSGTRIVDKDDKTVIVPTEDAVLTLSTCYPFNAGPAPDRYIVSANLLENKTIDSTKTEQVSTELKSTE